MNHFELKTLKLLANLNLYVVLVYLFRPFQSVSVELTKPPNFRNDFNQSAFLWCVGMFLKKRVVASGLSKYVLNCHIIRFHTFFVFVTVFFWSGHVTLIKCLKE